MVLAPVVASFVMSTRLMETPTPIPSLSPVPIVSPFATPSTIVAARVFALTTPPEAIVTPPVNCAWDLVVMMLIVTAAATWTDVLPLPPALSPVAAFGVLVVEASLPVLSLRSLFAFVTCSSDLPLTSLDEVSSPSAFPPFALASDALSLSDDPFAARLTAPPAEMFRATVAVTSSSTIARASARPIDTSAPPALALAVVIVVVSCVAVSVTLPEAASVCVLSPPIVALVMTVG